MLDEEQHVADALLLTELDQSFLQTHRGCVIAAAEIEDGDHAATMPQLGYSGRGFEGGRKVGTRQSTHEPVSGEAAGR